MPSNFKKVRVGFAGGMHHGKAARADALIKRDCSADQLYTSPKGNDEVSTENEVTFSWSNSCIDPAPQEIDLYLFAPNKNSSMIQAFGSAPYKDGSVKITLNPNWWGMDSSVQLQLSIVPHGTPSYLSKLPVGPVWTANYDAQNHPVKQEGDVPLAQRIKNVLHNLSPGATAAAVIIPLLVIFGLGAYAYIRYNRKKQAKKSERFSTAIDQRMSTISGDWRVMSGAGGNAAVRQSMAFRGSSDARPASTFSTANQAGFGSNFGGLNVTEVDVPQMRQPRPSLATGDRVSRVSFAADPRGSIVDKERPPMPRYVRKASYEDEKEGVDRALTMSPPQIHGPALLQPGEIAARASMDGDEALRREMLQMPAMTMMRTGHTVTGSGTDDFVIQNHTGSSDGTISPINVPAAPSPAFTGPAGARAPAGLNVSSHSMQSPDAMLRAYAEGRTPLTASPSPVGGGMRVLYQHEPAPGTPSAASDNNPFRKSMATRSMYTESMYSGMVEEDQHPPFDPNHQNGGAYGGKVF